MKKQDIRSIYTQKVAELLNQGCTIFPDSMNGSQGEIAHIDLTNGWVLLTREHHWDRDEDGYTGDTILLTVGRAAPDTRGFDNWDGTVWNSRLEPLFQIEWAWVGSNRRHDWYTDMEEGKRISLLQWERYKAQKTERRETPGDAFKSPASAQRTATRFPISSTACGSESKTPFTPRSSAWRARWQRP